MINEIFSAINFLIGVANESSEAADKEFDRWLSEDEISAYFAEIRAIFNQLRADGIVFTQLNIYEAIAKNQSPGDVLVDKPILSGTINTLTYEGDVQLAKYKLADVTVAASRIVANQFFRNISDAINMYCNYNLSYYLERKRYLLDITEAIRAKINNNIKRSADAAEAEHKFRESNNKLEIPENTECKKSD